MEIRTAQSLYAHMKTLTPVKAAAQAGLFPGNQATNHEVCLDQTTRKLEDSVWFNNPRFDAGQDPSRVQQPAGLDSSHPSLISTWKSEWQEVK